MPRAATPRTCSTVASASLVLVVFGCALLFWGGGTARAATTHGLSSTPPLALGPAASSTPSHPSAATPGASSTPGSGSATSTRLPATGYDAAIVALLGMGLMAAGLGLRRLTADGPGR